MVLVGSCLFFACCLDSNLVVHCLSSEFIDYKLLVEVIKNSLQSTDSASFIKKAEELLERRLTPDDVVKLLESKIESDRMDVSLFTRVSNLSDSHKLVLAVGLVCFGYTTSSIFFGQNLMSTYSGSLAMTNDSLRTIFFRSG